jgi:hypothetical protein
MNTKSLCGSSVPKLPKCACVGSVRKYGGSSTNDNTIEEIAEKISRKMKGEAPDTPTS